MTTWITGPGIACPTTGHDRVPAADITLTLTRTDRTVTWLCPACHATHNRPACPDAVRILTHPHSGVTVAYDIPELADPARHKPHHRNTRYWTAVRVGPDDPYAPPHQRGLLDPTNPDHQEWWTRQLASLGVSEGVRGW